MRTGITAHKGAQRMLKDRELAARAQALDDLSSILSTEAGRRWFWLEYFNTLASEIPTHSNVEMTGAVFLHNRAAAKLSEAHRFPELFLEAFKESIARGAENIRFEQQLKSELKKDGDNDGEKD